MNGLQKEIKVDNLHYFRDTIKRMNDLYNSLENGGKLYVTFPVYPYDEAFDDPNILKCFTKNTFKYFVKNSSEFLNKGMAYGIKPFKIMTQSLTGHFMEVILIK